MSTPLTEDERDLITAWVTATRPDRIHAMRAVEVDALAWLEDGDRHAHAYDPHSYAAAGVAAQETEPMVSEFLWNVACAATVLFVIVGAMYTIADWWGSR